MTTAAPFSLEDVAVAGIAIRDIVCNFRGWGRAGMSARPACQICPLLTEPFLDPVPADRAPSMDGPEELGTESFTMSLHSVDTLSVTEAAEVMLWFLVLP